LKLTWNAGAIEQGWLTVSKLKTEAGTRRTVPLTSRVCSVLTLWLSRFVDSGLDAYVALWPSFELGPKLE
jgi:hypothetical protein